MITNKQKNKENKMTKKQNVFKSTKVYHLKISSDKYFTIRSKQIIHITIGIYERN